MSARSPSGLAAAIAISMKPGVRDGRVGEDPLDVPLHERRDVAPGERDARDHRDRVAPEVLVLRERDRQHAVGDDERGDLRRRRHERGHRRRRALVDVRRPHVERRRRRLEREPDDDHREPDDEHRGVRRARSAPILSNDELAGRAVDERRAEEQRRRADRADDQVLEARLERARSGRCRSRVST